MVWCQPHIIIALLEGRPIGRRTTTELQPVASAEKRLHMKLALVLGIVLVVASTEAFSQRTTTNARSAAAPRPRRELTPPFPDGVCGGELVTIPPSSTYSIDVRLAGNSLVLPPRPIQVWLPPDYRANASTKHPVIYCHDGQNAIVDNDSWTGRSWRMAGAVTRLYEYGLLTGPMPLLVLMPSEDSDLVPAVRRRHLEYGNVNSPFAKAHADFVGKTLTQVIASRFRTDRSFLLGTSMGGQASLHILLKHPDKFEGAACLSPYFDDDIRKLVSSSASLRDKRIYMDIGGDVNEIKVPIFDFFDHTTEQHFWNPGYWWLDTQLQASVKAMEQALRESRADLVSRTIPGGRHNERAWSQRIHEPLLHLLHQ